MSALILTVFILASPTDSILVDADINRIKTEIESEKGVQPVLINVWANWCAPCVKEFPYLMKLNHEYGDRFRLLLISGDFDEARPEAENFLKNQNVDFETYFKTGNDHSFIQNLSPEWSGALPFTMLINTEGKVDTLWEGAAEFEIFEKALLSVIKKGKS